MLSVVITLLTLLLGFPIALLIATQPTRIGNLLIICVLLPFWTSLLVRTTSWIALLQQQGIINDILVFIGIIGDDGRLAMIHNATGTVIAMTHILLPFMVLPLYSVMKTIPPTYMRAATSLARTLSRHSGRFTSQHGSGYRRGRHPRLHSGHWLLHHARTGGWHRRYVHFQPHRLQHLVIIELGLAAALGVILLGIVLVCYLLYDKIVGIDNMKLG